MLRTTCTLILLFVLYSPPVADAVEEITVVCNVSTIENYTKLVASKGGNPFVIRNFNSPYASRPVVNLLLIAQSLHEGGLDFVFDFIVSPNPGRSLNEVKLGNAVIYQADMWESEFDDSVYKSHPIIHKGQFQKGFYVNENSPLLQATQSIQHLKSTPLLIETTWRSDIKLLKDIGFTNITEVPKYELLLQMIAMGRKDMTFLEFPDRDDLVHKTRHGDLQPIQGIKVIFPESRHFMVSKKHPKGKMVFTALQAGLQILHKRGTITRAQIQAGVLNTRVDKWLTITP